MSKPNGIEGVDYDDNISAERRAYRKALDWIIAHSDDPGAVAVAHTAITPYTNWVAASPEEEAALNKALGK